MTPDIQLNLRARHPDYQKFLTQNEVASSRVRKLYRCILNVKYGEKDLQTMDIFPSPIAESPILVFIHGGYWRALDKASYSFIAEPFIKKNFTVCIINYRLMPQVTMKSLINDVKAALRWIAIKAAQYNGNPNKMVLSGHSAGGHLAIIAYLKDQKVKAQTQAICSLSGIFDLGPIEDSYLNKELQLSKVDVAEFSVLNKDLRQVSCPVLVSVGSEESYFFIEQSKSLYTKFKYDAPLEYFEYQQLNHYQIVHKMGQESSPLVQFILAKTNVR